MSGHHPWPPPQEKRKPLIAVFEDRGKRRVVKSFCKTCKARPMDWPFVIISPQGKAHHSGGWGDTWCGKDATGDDWWHKG